jgi:uncharacterized protein YjbI with pentapeptide repeats
MSEQQSQPDHPATPATTDTKQDETDDSEPTPERQAELRAAYEANVAMGKLPYEGIGVRTYGEVEWVERELRQTEPDDREPTPERQAELREAYEANVAAGKAPYAEVWIGTRGELQWIMQERKWSGESGSDSELPEGYERANLSGAGFADANLSEAFLHSANLSEADLSLANLSGAVLSHANLSGAELFHADLSKAFLFDATLSKAALNNANLSEANLSDANLSGAVLDSATLSKADLHRANLSGADLSGTRMDATTDLRGARLDTHMRLADVVWNGVPLTRLNWPT